MNNGNKPASPQSGYSTMDGADYISADIGGTGLTKREHFAAMAMQGLLAGGTDARYMDSLTDRQMSEFDWDSGAAISLLAVNYANALLKALEETK